MAFTRGRMGNHLEGHELGSDKGCVVCKWIPLDGELRRECSFHRKRRIWSHVVISPLRFSPPPPPLPTLLHRPPAPRPSSQRITACMRVCLRDGRVVFLQILRPEETFHGDLISFSHFPDEQTKDSLLFIVIEHLLGAHSLPSLAVVADKTLTKPACS